MKWIILIIAALFVIAGCAAPEAPSDDALGIPDTSLESSDTTPDEPISNDDIRTKTPDKRMYISARQSTCIKIQYICEDGMEPFFDTTGCGCDPIDPESSQEARDETDAEVTVEEAVEEETVEKRVDEVKAEGNEDEVSTDCYPEQRDVDACIEIYAPVCGWFDESIQCLTYPCASTYSNSCFACQNEDVSRWTSGECPTPGSSPQ